MLCRQRPQYPADQPGLLLDDLHGRPPLRHGPLPDHFTGDEEGGADLLHVLGRPLEAQDAAVKTRIEPPAMAMAGVAYRLHQRL